MSTHSTSVTVTIAAITAALGLSLGYFQGRQEGFATREDVSSQITHLTLDSLTVPIEGSPKRGGYNAKTTLVVFMDFAVPASRQVYKEYLDHAFKVHGDNLAVVYKAYPLAANPDSMTRARAAAAAQLQNRFWEMAEALFEVPTNPPLDKEAALGLAKKLGLDAARFASDFDAPAVDDRIRKDVALGEKLGIKGAPTLFVNGHEIVFQNAITQDEIMSAVNAEMLRLERLASLPSAYYYLGSIVNQYLDDVARAQDTLGRPVRGAQNALVTIVEYSDYECPFCKKADATVRRLLTEYPDSVRLVFSHNPLPFHKNARLAHQAAYAAGKQGKFWEMNDILFQNQKNLSEPSLIKYAQELGLNMARFKEDLHSPEAAAVIDRDLKEGVTRNVSGTPHFLINGQELSGALPYSSFKTAVEKSLVQASALQKKTGLKGEALYAEIMKSAPVKAAPVPADAKLFVDIPNAPVWGSPDAPVTIVEFTDFECPFCSRANATLKTLVEKNPDKVRVVFKHHPLAMHKNADAAHRAAQAAALQGKFWEMYHLLFDNQRKLSPDDLKAYAVRLGLDVDKFLADMESEEVKKSVAGDLAQASTLGVRGTPHFFVNGKRLSGAQPLEKFQAMVDSAFNDAKPFVERGLKGDALYRAITQSDERSARPDVGGRKRLARAGQLQRAELHKMAGSTDNIVLEVGDSYARGPENAPVTIFQFSEFQCPFCARVEPTVEEIRKAYGDKVRIVFKNFPLRLHQNAKLASEAALAAGAQGKFWEMQALLFQNQKNLVRPALSDYARQLGLDVAAFDAALDAHTYAAQVDKETAEGRSVGVTGTPSFVINGKLVRGAVSFESFKAEIDAALSQK